MGWPRPGRCLRWTWHSPRSRPKPSLDHAGPLWETRSSKSLILRPGCPWDGIGQGRSTSGELKSWKASLWNFFKSLVNLAFDSTIYIISFEIALLNTHFVEYQLYHNDFKQWLFPWRGHNRFQLQLHSFVHITLEENRGLCYKTIMLAWLKPDKTTRRKSL